MEGRTSDQASSGIFSTKRLNSALISDLFRRPGTDDGVKHLAQHSTAYMILYFGIAVESNVQRHRHI
eukprot:320552-Chlamydomonas_euryale.AAC.9